MSAKAPIRPEESSRRRRTALIILAVIIFLLLFVVSSQQAFDLTFLRPTTSEQTLIFSALSALIFLLLLALMVVLVRTLLKLFAETRGGVLGSKFRTKMVLGALVLSFGPVLFMFMFAYGLMNRSIDKWFSRPVEEVRQDTARVGTLLSNYALDNAKAEATTIAEAAPTQRGFEKGDFGQVVGIFRHHEAALQGGFAVAIVDGEAEAAFHLPEPWPMVRQRIGEHQGTLLPLPKSFTLNGVEYMLGAAMVGGRGGWVLVGMPLPQEFSRTMAQIEASQRRYMELAQQRKLVRRTYMGLLLLLTVLVLFASTWMALFLSKFVTRPVAALAEATEQISRGKFDYRVAVDTGDELGKLLLSFNRMAEELESSRRQIEASSRELADANAALEQRRRHMETILESIPTGVLSLDAERRITHTNNALNRILWPDGNGSHEGVRVDHIFPPDVDAGDAPSAAQGRPHGLHHQPDGDPVSAPPSERGRDRRVVAARRPASRLRARLRGSIRSAQGAEAGRLARGGAPRGARNQEPADAHRALRRAHPPPPGARHAARRAVAGSDQGLRRDHRRRRRNRAHAGGRVLDLRPLPAGAAAARRRQHHRGIRARHVQRAARRHPRPHPARARPAESHGRSGGHQARHRQPGGQRRRSHAGISWSAKWTSAPRWPERATRSRS